MPYSKEEKAAYDKAYREANKERRSAYNKAWNEANKARCAVSARAYREANKEKIAAYKIANKDKITAYREANKEKAHAYRGAWREANMSRFAAYSSKRRALKLKLIPKHLKNCPVEKQRVLDIHKLSTLISKATGIEYHVDHMWPLSDGGPHWSGNMQIITARENLTKNASVDLELKHNIQQSLKETM